MFGWKRKSFRYALTHVQNIHEDVIEDFPDLVNFIVGENMELQARQLKGSVVITKYRKDKHEETILYAQKLELPIAGGLEEFEALLSNFASKKPLAFEPPASDERPLQEPQVGGQTVPSPEQLGYAAAPELDFEEEAEDTLSVSAQEETPRTSASSEALEAVLAEKEAKLKAQEEEILQLRAQLEAKEKEGVKAKTPEAAKKETEKATSGGFLCLSSAKQATSEAERLLKMHQALGLSKETQKDIATEALELMHQAEKGMQPRDVIEYQVAVEFEATKKEELKAAEEEAKVKQDKAIADAQKRFEEKQNDIYEQSKRALHQAKTDIEQKFEKLAFEEVNARMQKQKKYIEGFISDLEKKMHTYIENGEPHL